MPQKFRLTISPEPRNEKPNSGWKEQELINNANVREATLQDLKEAVLQGKTWSPCIFKDKKCDLDFEAANALVADFDNSITIAEIMSRAKEYGFDYNLIYTTFSDSIPRGVSDLEVLKKATRFRIVIMLPKEVDQLNLYKSMLKDCLLLLFPEIDKKVSATAMFYGGKNLVYYNEVYQCDISNLLLAALCYWGKSHNYAVRKKRYSQTTKSHTEILNFFENFSKTANSIYNNNIENAEKGKKRGINPNVWRKIAEECSLFSDFYYCKRKIEHMDLFFLYLAMRKFEGGIKLWKEKVKENTDIDDAKVAISEHVERQVNKGIPFKESPLENYAPDDPATRKYMYLTDIFFNRLRNAQVVEYPNLIELEEAQNEIEIKIKQALTSKTTVVKVIKGAAGLGKSEIIRKYACDRQIIAVPTYKLLEEYSDALKRKSVAHNNFPELPDLPDPIEKQYLFFIRCGLYSQATALLMQISFGKFPEDLRLKATEEFRLTKSLRGYFDQAAKCLSEDKLLLITHKRLLVTIDFPKHDTIIVDEDIIPLMNPIAHCSLETLKKFLAFLDEINNVYLSPCKKAVQEILNIAASAGMHKNEVYNVAHLTPLSENTLRSLQKVMMENKKFFEGVLPLLYSDHYMVVPQDYMKPDGEIMLSFVKKDCLPFGKKVIMLSATGNEDICKLFFGNVEWFEVPGVKQKGKCIQFSNKGFSRRSLKHCTYNEFDKLIAPYLKQCELITFKDQVKLEQMEAKIWLGNASGYNDFKGGKVVVKGTPYFPEYVYLLLAKSFGVPFDSGDAKLEYQECVHNGFRFNLVTYSHEGLRLIQRYLIESVLIQACGRARTIREEEAVVILFAKYPLPGFEQHNTKDAVIILDNIIGSPQQEHKENWNPKLASTGSASSFDIPGLGEVDISVLERLFCSGSNAA